MTAEVAKTLVTIAAVTLGAMVMAFLLTECGPLPPPDPPDPVPPHGGAGPVLSDCERAGERLRELDCHDGSGTPLWETPEGKSFTEACEHSASMGRDWCPAAIAEIVRCEEIDQAMRSCK